MNNYIHLSLSLLSSHIPNYPDPFTAIFHPSTRCPRTFAPFPITWLLRPPPHLHLIPSLASLFMYRPSSIRSLPDYQSCHVPHAFAFKPELEPDPVTEPEPACKTPIINKSLNLACLYLGPIFLAASLSPAVTLSLVLLPLLLVLMSYKYTSNTYTPIYHLYYFCHYYYCYYLSHCQYSNNMMNDYIPLWLKNNFYNY